FIVGFVSSFLDLPAVGVTCRELLLERCCQVSQSSRFFFGNVPPTTLSLERMLKPRSFFLSITAQPGEVECPCICFGKFGLKDRFLLLMILQPLLELRDPQA